MQMTMVKLGKKGQVSIPKSVLKQLGIEGEVPLLVEATAEGAILLRPAGVYPLEIYSEERVREFDTADRMSPRTAARLKKALKRR
jgi:AbrB family looped-hinge helix DNA binding protein